LGLNILGLDSKSSGQVIESKLQNVYDFNKKDICIKKDPLLEPSEEQSGSVTDE